MIRHLHHITPVRRDRPFSTLLHAVIAAVIVLQCTWSLALAVNTEWHHEAHHDADEADHDCPVVQLAHGFWAAPATPFVAIPRPPLPPPVPILPDTARPAPAPFLTWHRLEHAPPERASA